ncbi:MAG: U32 family peptidase [Oscillospiraceae bacterium]|nr:U32 family peptidase [Oscillospiraceae bacterium]
MLELLAPAGSMEALRAAVQNGANAVYLGVGAFNARQGAKNFTPQTLVEAVKYCHVRGVQVHLTLNTLVADREMKEVAETIRHAAQNNIDAFIVQDLGVVQLCRQIAPHIPIHGSTQMTVHSLSGVQLCAAMGMKRVVLSRELSREEIRYICSQSPIEIEVFGHGALCMCYSGQCYMSAVIGGRSGNRGRCAQPCRQSYGYGHWQDRYPLSLKDNCLVHYVRELEEMGVASLKLEGRMKKPEYVATVTAVYRKAIDEGVVTKPMMEMLMTAFNRQGFTDGYYTSRVDGKMFGVRQDTRDDPEWLKAARQSFEAGETPLVDLKMRAVVSVDGSSLTATDPEGRSCHVEGPMPELAINVPLTGQVLAGRVAKTGGTPYRVVEVRTHVDPGLTISAAAINHMRRDVINQLTAIRARREDHPIRKPKSVPMYKGPKELPGLTVQVTTKAQLTPNLLNLETAMLYVPLHLLMEDREMTEVLVARGRLAVALPRIVHDGEMPKLIKELNLLRDLGVKDALVGNLGLLGPVREAGMRIHGDFGLNIYNSATMNVMQQLELTSATVSFEATMPQIRDMSKAVKTEFIAYGRLPLMVTEQCLIRNHTGECACQTLGSRHNTKLVDKTGAEFPVIKDGDNCRSVLLNGKKLSWLDRQDDINKLGVWAMRLYFTTESAREVDRILGEYLNPTQFDPGACTRGLYLRGVE